MKVNTINKLAASALLITLALTSLGGCLPPEVAHAAPTDTPVAAQTINPTNTPSAIPTYTPAPTQAPMPELTLEQKKMLLGINEKFTNYDVGNIFIYNVKFKNENYRFWTVCSLNQDKTNKEKDSYVYDFFNIFNMEYLFSVTVPKKDEFGQPVSIAMYKKYLSETRPSLNGLSFYLSLTLGSVATYYKEWGVDYNNNQTLNEWADKQRYGTPTDYDKVKDTPLIKEKALELYLDSTPTKEILPFWMYIPGAKIPDELKGIYNEADYPPAPALPETTLQQSNRIYNEKAFTSKDGAASIAYPFERVSKKEEVDNNVPFGYRTKDYYGSGYVVTGIDHHDKYTKIKV